MIDAPKFQKLHQAPTADDQDKKLREVGKLYEKQFLREMVKQMRATIQESGFIKKNQAEKIFSEQLDQNYVEQWGDKGGIGLGDLVYNQLIEKYGVQLGIKPQQAKPQGPLTLDQKSNFAGRLRSAPAEKSWSFEFARDLSQPTSSLQSVRAPWEGKLLSATKLESDETLLEVLHDSGLKSRLTFRGEPVKGLVGKDLQAGEEIGLLSPQARSLIWNVEPVSKSVSE